MVGTEEESLLFALLKRDCEFCAVCKVQLNSTAAPKLLPCLHPVCKACVTNNSGENSFKECPACGQYFNLHEIGDCFIFKDYSPKCGGCDESSVSGWCSQCEEALCSDCVSAHRRVKMTRNHTIIPKESAPVLYTSLRCTSHTQERLKLFCLTCEELTCRDCQLIDHRGHSFQLLDEALVSQKEQLINLQSSIRDQRKTLTNSIQDLEQRLCDINEQKSSSKEKVTSLLRSVYLSLVLRCNHLCKEMERLYDEEEKSLKTMKITMKRLAERQEYVAAFIQKILTTDGQCILLHKKQIGKRVQKLLAQRTFLPDTVIHLKFQLKNDMLQNIKTFGSFVVTRVPPTNLGKHKSRSSEPTDADRNASESRTLAHAESSDPCVLPPAKESESASSRSARATQESLDSDLRQIGAAAVPLHLPTQTARGKAANRQVGRTLSHSVSSQTSRQMKSLRRYSYPYSSSSIPVQSAGNSSHPRSSSTVIGQTGVNVPFSQACSSIPGQSAGNSSHSRSSSTMIGQTAINWSHSQTISSIPGQTIGNSSHPQSSSTVIGHIAVNMPHYQPVTSRPAQTIGNSSHPQSSSSVIGQTGVNVPFSQACSSIPGQTARNSSHPQSSSTVIGQIAVNMPHYQPVTSRPAQTAGNSFHQQSSSTVIGQTGVNVPFSQACSSIPGQTVGNLSHVQSSSSAIGQIAVNMPHYQPVTSRPGQTAGNSSHQQSSSSVIGQTGVNVALSQACSSVPGQSAGNSSYVQSSSTVIGQIAVNMPHYQPVTSRPGQSAGNSSYVQSSSTVIGQIAVNMPHYQPITSRPGQSAGNPSHVQSSSSVIGQTAIHWPHSQTISSIPGQTLGNSSNQQSSSTVIGQTAIVLPQYQPVVSIPVQTVGNLSHQQSSSSVIGQAAVNLPHARPIICMPGQTVGHSTPPQCSSSVIGRTSQPVLSIQGQLVGNASHQQCSSSMIGRISSLPHSQPVRSVPVQTVGNLSRAQPSSSATVQTAVNISHLQSSSFVPGQTVHNRFPSNQNQNRIVAVPVMLPRPLPVTPAAASHVNPARASLSHGVARNISGSNCPVSSAPSLIPTIQSGQTVSKPQTASLNTSGQSNAVRLTLFRVPDGELHSLGRTLKFHNYTPVSTVSQASILTAAPPLVTIPVAVGNERSLHPVQSEAPSPSQPVEPKLTELPVTSNKSPAPGALTSTIQSELTTQKSQRSTCEPPVKAPADSVCELEMSLPPCASPVAVAGEADSDLPTSTVPEIDTKELPAVLPQRSLHVSSPELCTTSTEECSSNQSSLVITECVSLNQSSAEHWLTGLPKSFREMLTNSDSTSSEVNVTPGGDASGSETDHSEKWEYEGMENIDFELERLDETITREAPELIRPDMKHLRASLLRLPISGSSPPRYRVIPNELEGELLLQEMKEGQVTDRFLRVPVPPAAFSLSDPRPSDSPLLAEVLDCAVCWSAGASLRCSQCGRTFHPDCHVPQVFNPIGVWVCSMCQDIDAADPYSCDRIKEPYLSLQDQRRCEQVMLSMMCEENGYLLYERTETAGCVEFDFILNRLLEKRTPPYRSAAEMVSDVWAIFDALSSNSKNKESVSKLQVGFEARLNAAFGESLHASLLKPFSADLKNLPETQVENDKAKNTLKRMKAFLAGHCPVVVKKPHAENN
ncbi:mucin-3B isoform X2 [Trichomycterus rosablanca]|uniref:mucin-3B isoform X2 n=1 Tax=Trichomycterus rosablanca TaxID=2290929 RepID=UPI002F360862